MPHTAILKRGTDSGLSGIVTATVINKGTT